MCVCVCDRSREEGVFIRCVCVCFSLQIEQVSQLSSLVEAQLQYHKQAVLILEELSDKLKDR